MTSPVFGSAAVGLVWGWLVGSRVFRVRSWLATALAVCIATLVLSGEILFLTDWYAIPVFLSAAIFALIVHVTWLYRLRARSEDQVSF
jgi:hypothetical protein